MTGLRLRALENVTSSVHSFTRMGVFLVYQTEIFQHLCTVVTGKYAIVIYTANAF